MRIYIQRPDTKITLDVMRRSHFILRIQENKRVVIVKNRWGRAGLSFDSLSDAMNYVSIVIQKVIIEEEIYEVTVAEGYTFSGYSCNGSHQKCMSIAKDLSRRLNCWAYVERNEYVG